MKKLFLLPLAVLLILSSCNNAEKIKLFNGENLDNWTIFMPDSIDKESVFRAEDGKLLVSGIPNGYIRTKEEYSSYELHLEWRWVEEPANSGVLLHTTGDDIVWPNCIEAQIKAGSAGDFVLMRQGTGLTVKDSSYMVEPEQRPYMAIPKFEEGSELAPGEWNSYDITVTEEIIELKVNGTVQNIGTAPTKTKGSICLQSEGGPMEFQNIYLKPIK
jgi:hypothetical protein